MASKNVPGMIDYSIWRLKLPFDSVIIDYPVVVPRDSGVTVFPKPQTEDVKEEGVPAIPQKPTAILENPPKVPDYTGVESFPELTEDMKDNTISVEEADQGVKGGSGSQGVGNPVKVEGRGSTGRTTPNSLNEQMAMHLVQSNPLEGATKVPVEMTDSRWPSSEGWVKMQSVVQNADGTKTTVHYVYNEITGALDDFKFK